MTRTGYINIIEAWAAAIAREEGFGKPGSRPTRNHNPGDLKPPNNDPGFWNGQVGVDPQGFAIFKDDIAGTAALHTDLYAAMKHHGGLTLGQFMAIFAPAADHNDPLAYAKLCADAIRQPTTITLSELRTLQEEWSA